MLLAAAFLFGFGCVANASAQAAAVADPPAAGSSAPNAAKPDVVLSFHFAHAVATVPEYTFTLHEGGAGSYLAGSPATAAELHLTPEATAHLFELARATNGLRNCNSKARNLANTGLKTLTLTTSAGVVTCTYNYSDSKPVQDLTAVFQAMEFTLEEGARLAHEHRFDRLGLDAEMRALVEAVKANRAAGLANIASTLKSLADDPLVLERVRASAAALLEQGTLGR